MKISKTVNRNIFPFDENNYMSAVRGKLDYLNLILISARLLTIDQKFSRNSTSCYLKLKIGKMARIFIYGRGKFFSFSFPFNVLTKNQNVLKITTYAGLTVDGQSISSAIGLLRNSNSIIHAINSESGPESYHFDLLGKNLLEELLMTEPGYIRYDKDPINANGNLHPLNHLDINFSSYGTYKIGLSQDLLEREFEDIMNIETDCKFLDFSGK